MCFGMCCYGYCFSWQMHGPTARIVICRVNVQNDFRQVLVYPVGAAVLRYATGDLVVVDLCLQFRWRNSPGFGGQMVSALEHAHARSTFQNAPVSPPGAAAVDKVRLAPSWEGSVRPLPRDCRTGSGRGGYAGCSFSCGTA